LLGRHAFVEDYESKRSAVGVSRCRSDYCGRVRRIIAIKPERDIDFLRHGQISLFRRRTLEDCDIIGLTADISPRQ